MRSIVDATTTATPAIHWQVRFLLTSALGRFFEAEQLQSRYLRAASGSMDPDTS